MRKVTTVLLSTLLLLVVGCGRENTKTQDSMSNISTTTIDKIVKQLSEQYPEQSSRIERSVPQVAALWQNTDGTEDEFSQFCIEQFVANDDDLANLAIVCVLVNVKLNLVRFALDGLDDVVDSLSFHR